MEGVLAKDWKAYQEEAAAFFRTLGMSASTDTVVDGVRTKHAIDVFVQIELAGFNVKWVVECKQWNHPVTKLHVLALREIVSDLGADRGVILCENGFQSGAHEAAQFTNVQISSLAELGFTSRAAIASFQLRELFNRSCLARERYWKLPKGERIKRGLRGDGRGIYPIYNGAWVAEATENILGIAFRGLYPIKLDMFDLIKLNKHPPIVLEGPDDVLALLEPAIKDLEGRLDLAEAGF